jgi:hypothetical protein
MSLILASAEVEIRRIPVQDQPGQKVIEILSQSIKAGVVVHSCHLAVWEA